MKKLILGLGLFSSACIAAPVGLTGSGMFSCDIIDQVYGFSAQGSDGTNTVSIFVGGLLGQQSFTSCIGTSLSGSTLFSATMGQASINDISSPRFSFSIGGPGTLTLFDVSQRPIASISTVGYIGNVTYTTFNQSPRDIAGRFAVVATPEPATWTLCAAGLGTVFLRRRRRTHRSEALRGGV